MAGPSSKSAVQAIENVRSHEKPSDSCFNQSQKVGFLSTAPGKRSLVDMVPLQDHDGRIRAFCSNEWELSHVQPVEVTTFPVTSGDLDSLPMFHR